MPCKTNDKKAGTKKVDAKKVETKKVEAKKEDTKGVYRVSYNSETKKWVIKRDGAERVIDSKPTKEEALKRVKQLSENQDVGFTVKKKDGKFQKVK